MSLKASFASERMTRLKFSQLRRFYRATLCVSAVIAVARCPSVRHVCAFYPHRWRYYQTSLSAR